MQKSGRLSEESLELLALRAQALARQGPADGLWRELPLDVLFVRDDDIPDLVQEDVCDLGLVGLNVLEEKRLAGRARPCRSSNMRTLDFGRCRLALAVPEGFNYQGSPSRGQAHRHHLPCWRGFWRDQRRPRRSHPLSGSVEIAPRLGRADLICDLVSAGSTLPANHLREVRTCSRATRS